MAPIRSYILKHWKNLQLSFARLAAVLWNDLVRCHVLPMTLWKLSAPTNRNNPHLLLVKNLDLPPHISVCHKRLYWVQDQMDLSNVAWVWCKSEPEELSFSQHGLRFFGGLFFPYACFWGEDCFIPLERKSGWHFFFSLIDYLNNANTLFDWSHLSANATTSGHYYSRMACAGKA